MSFALLKPLAVDGRTACRLPGLSGRPQLRPVAKPLQFQRLITFLWFRFALFIRRSERGYSTSFLSRLLLAVRHVAGCISVQGYAYVHMYSVINACAANDVTGNDVPDLTA